MTFNNNMIAVIKCRNKVLREDNSSGTQIVTIPFGSDYSILLKNKDTRSAVVKVEIDGKDVLSGNQLILKPNTSTELLGYMKDGIVSNRFRFIKKTEEIEQYRGSRVDDGIVRIEFKYEQKQETIDIVHYHRYYSYCPYVWNPLIIPYPIITWGSTSKPTNVIDSDITGSTIPLVSSTNCNLTADANSQHFISGTISSDEGITVPGEQAQQHFDSGCVGTLEETSHVINILLRGTSEQGTVVAAPITVSSKLKCSTCGREWESSYKFCPNCSTSLR
jgi:hypothetical protein